jgi:3-hydroxybutyryl-CoA dehydrogenase
MKLIEIIPGLQTSENTIRVICDLAVAMGKTITLSTDMPGFIVNRLLMPYINEAIQALQEVGLHHSTIRM